MRSKNWIEKILENWPARVLSLLAAIGLFYFHRNEGLAENYFYVPLQVKVAEGFISASPVTNKVKIFLKARSDEINNVLEEDIEAFIDLTQRTADGRYKVAVQIEKKGSALDMDPLEIRVEPKSVSLLVEQKLVRSLEVSPEISGYPAQGYSLDQFFMNPSTVEVEGPISEVSSLRGVSTEEIDLTGKRENFSERVRLVQPSPLVNFPGGNIVEFVGVINEAIVFKKLDDLEVLLADLNPNLKAVGQVPSASIKIQGSQNILEDTPVSEYSLVVDCQDIRMPGIYNLPIKVLVPPGVILLEFDPEIIKIKVESR